MLKRATPLLLFLPLSSPLRFRVGDEVVHRNGKAGHIVGIAIDTTKQDNPYSVYFPGGAHPSPSRNFPIKIVLHNQLGPLCDAQALASEGTALAS